MAKLSSLIKTTKLEQMVNITLCHTLISSGDLCLMTCDFSLVLARCLEPIIRQFVKFQDMPENQKNIDAQSVSFRDTPEIKWKHSCTISEVPKHSVSQKGDDYLIHKVP